MNRGHQMLLIAASLLLAWLWMQVVHELGHCVAAWLTGGSIERVVLHPLTISRTDVVPNPSPLVVVWAGPLFGAALPLLVWIGARAAGWQRAWWLRFFAGFCLLANGLYIGVGSFEGIGDAGDMLRHGSPIWTLWLFGLVTAPAGLALWNGLGPHFGLVDGCHCWLAQRCGNTGGQATRGTPIRSLDGGLAGNPPPIDRPVTYSCLALLAATVALQCWLSPRA